MHFIRNFVTLHLPACMPETIWNVCWEFEEFKTSFRTRLKFSDVFRLLIRIGILSVRRCNFSIAESLTLPE